MCSKLISLVVAVVCVAAVTQARGPGGGGGGGGGPKGFGGRLGGKGGNQTYRRFNHTAMMSCCPTFPTFIKEKSVADCKASEPSGGAPPPPPPPGGGGKGGGRWGKGGDRHRNRSCAMECAFKTEGLISTGADGKNIVDLVALNARLTTLAVAPWDGPIEAAKANCTAAAPKVEGDQTCTSGAMAVTKCLFKYLMKTCPAPVNSPECVERMKMMAEMEGKMEAFRAKFGKRA